MKGFDKLSIKSAVKSRNKFDLSHSHLTTMDFGEIVPLLSEEVVPGDKFNVSAQYFSRMAPLAKPTYGKFSFRTMAAFVPYYQVADDAEAWLAGNTTWLGASTNLRSISYTQYVYYLISAGTEITSAYCVTNELIPSGATYTSSAEEGYITFTNSSNSALTYTFAYDWSYTDSSDDIHYLKFEGVNKYYIKVLNALGYALPQNASLYVSSPWFSKFNTKTLNAMPLLCFAKAYNDYMSQSQRANISELSSYLRCVKEDKGTTGYNNGSHYVLAEGIALILRNIVLQYENDYFTSAWQQPNRPLSNGNAITAVTAPYANGSYGVIASASDNNVSIPGGVSSISQRALDYLKSFDDWVRRNNYSGSRAVQQIYSRFGIKVEDYRSDYAHIIGTDSIPVQVGDITSQASTSDAILGEYAGKGIMSGDKGFSFDSSDYGMLFVFGWYAVQPMYSYGFDRTCLKSSPLDFYNPEFDGQGANAITYGEIFANPIPHSYDESLDSNVFGFTELYNEYRFGRDKITGEMRDYHKDAEMNTWHTGRLLSDIRKNDTLAAQTSVVNAMPQSDSEYNRIFSITDDSVNHFYLTAKFNISAVRPMLSLNQVPRLGEGDTQVPRNGNVVN